MKKIIMPLIVVLGLLLFLSVATGTANDKIKAQPTAETKARVVPEESEAPQIVTNITKQKAAEPTPTPATPEPEEYLIWMGWTECESGEESWTLTASDGGHAYGRYQLDDRHCLADFFRFCVEEDSENYESFTTFYYVDSKGKAHIKNTERIPEEWNWICYLKKEAFYAMQTRFAVEYYYEAAKKTLEQEIGIDIDKYGPVFRGTIMSLSIRNGSYASGMSSAINTYEKGISEHKWLGEIYAAEAMKHPDQASRWQTRQKNAAMATFIALKNKGATRKVRKKHQIEAI